MARNLLKNLAYCALCVCSAWLAAELTYGFFRAPEAPRPSSPRPSRAASAPAPKKDAPGYEAVLRRNLFRVPVEPGASFSPYGEDPERASGADEELLAAELEKMPISKQGWNLLGTVVNTLSPADNRAILSAGEGQSAYGPGDELKGWKIALIDRRIVIVEKNGRREKLLVGGSETKLPDNRAATPPQAKIRLNGKEIDRALQNIPALLSQAGFEPGQRNGVMGLNLTFVKPDGLFAKLGLRANDLLVEANGQTITNLGDLARLGSMTKDDNFRVELLRDGQNVSLEYVIAR